MNVVIIGCGYIGMEAGALWSRRGFHVTATTRTPERLAELSKVAQKSLIIKGNDEDELIPLIAGNEAILITISADHREHYESAYLRTAEIFRRLALEMNAPRQLIYTSSTSVYGDHRGLWVDETSELLANSQQARILIDAEKTYWSLTELGWHICILRLAEIYGPRRELSKRLNRLEGNALPGSGDQYTNMIHQQDCTAAIDYALCHRLEGIFNLADDDHPKRRDLYDQVTIKCHCPKVRWDPSLTGFHAGNKRVSNRKIKAAGFTFHHPHRVLS